MKKALAPLCLVGSLFALSACDTTGSGFSDTQPPYALERTASHSETIVAPAAPTPVAPAERIFHRAQTK